MASWGEAFGSQDQPWKREQRTKALRNTSKKSTSKVLRPEKTTPRAINPEREDGPQLKKQATTKGGEQ